MSRNILWYMFAMILASAACNNTKQSPSVITNNAANIGSERLYQNEWKAIELEDEPIPGEPSTSLIFTAGQVNKVTGYTGCNRTSGSFELSGSNGIKFSPMVSTRMACIDNKANDIEAKYLSALKNATAWSMDNDVLMLLNGEEKVAVFIAKPAALRDTNALNATWQLQFISGAKIALKGLFPNQLPTIRFQLPKLEASGNGGCNGYSVKFTINKQQLQFSNPLSTMMACEGNGEPVYFKTLQSITSHRLNGDTLIMSADGIDVLRFVKDKAAK